MATDDTTKKAEDAYEVIWAKDSAAPKLELDGKEYKFRNNNMMRISDRGLAMDIRNKYGQGKMPDVTVTKVKYPHKSDRGHKYFFSVPDLPWKRKAEEDATLPGR